MPVYIPVEDPDALYSPEGVTWLPERPLWPEVGLPSTSTLPHRISVPTSLRTIILSVEYAVKETEI